MARKGVFCQAPSRTTVYVRDGSQCSAQLTPASPRQNLPFDVHARKNVFVHVYIYYTRSSDALLLRPRDVPRHGKFQNVKRTSILLKVDRSPSFLVARGSRSRGEPASFRLDCSANLLLLERKLGVSWNLETSSELSLPRAPAKVFKLLVDRAATSFLSLGNACNL